MFNTNAQTICASLLNAATLLQPRLSVPLSVSSLHRMIRSTGSKADTTTQTTFTSLNESTVQVSADKENETFCCGILSNVHTSIERSGRTTIALLLFVWSNPV